MEYLEGVDLATWLRTRGPLPIDETLEFLLQLCEAIAEAHALGIVHRDLKPANIFCVRRTDGLLAMKVFDFGISKVAPREGREFDVNITDTASMIGSPLYMSPEQMSSAKDVDARTDVWALGIILYELLTGATPFYATTLPIVAIRIATEDPPPMRRLGDEVPKAIPRIVKRCLEKDRAKRYADVGELARALAELGPARAKAHAERAVRVLHRAGKPRSITDSPAPHVVEPVASSGVIARNVARSAAVRSGAKRWLFVSIALLATAVLAYAWLGREAPPERAKETASSASIATPAVALPPGNSVTVPAPTDGAARLAPDTRSAAVQELTPAATVRSIDQMKTALSPRRRAQNASPTAMQPSAAGPSHKHTLPPSAPAMPSVDPNQDVLGGRL